ncbi:hypothetical protein ACFIOY_29800 [Bradyrhizobium sp. TZ2]
MVPGRKPLVTLRDAAQYDIKLPKAERESPAYYEQDMPKGR